MADTRNQYAIARDHGEHVRKAGHATYKTYQTDIISHTGHKAGSLWIEICTECPYIKTPLCNHEKNSWDAEGKNLTCDLCGMDGT
jgi:hypothetical protein